MVAHSLVSLSTPVKFQCDNISTVLPKALVVSRHKDTMVFAACILFKLFIQLRNPPCSEGVGRGVGAKYPPGI